MNRYPLVAIFSLVFVACGGAQTAKQGEQTEKRTGVQTATEESPSASEAASDPDEFKINESTTAGDAHGEKPSKLKATKTKAKMKFFVIDKEKGPISGIVISMTDPDGQKFYTEETDSLGYAEVLVPIGKKYGLVFLTLGRKDIEKKVTVPDLPNQNIKLTLRYKRFDPAPEIKKTAPSSEKTPEETPAAQPRFVLHGVVFAPGKATLKEESFARLDRVVEYMTYKKSARIEFSGHTDAKGSAKKNKALSAKRAEACKQYLISKGIDKSRIDAVGKGSEEPIATNDTPEGRQKNRRTEAKEL